MIFASADRCVPLAALLAALLLVACGDDDEPAQTTAPAVTGASDTASAEQAPGTESPEDEPASDPATDEALIAGTLETVLGARNAADACGDYVTERYLSRAYGGRAGCEAAQAGAKPAKRVRVSRVVVTPDSVAQAAAVPTGGPYDAERLRAVLVLDDGTWKLDSLRSNVPVGP